MLAMVKTLKMMSKPPHILTDLTICRCFAAWWRHQCTECCNSAAEMDNKTKAACRGPNGAAGVSDWPSKEMVSRDAWLLLAKMALRAMPPALCMQGGGGAAGICRGAAGAAGSAAARPHRDHAHAGRQHCRAQ